MVVSDTTYTARRATDESGLLLPGVRISIHALREEGDGLDCSTAVMKPLFLSTPSARRATNMFRFTGEILIQFLSTPSARRATRQL